MIGATPSEMVHILVVEDDEIDAEAVRRAFRKHGMANPIFHARYGAEALNLLRERRELRTPVVLVVDINMPQMSGIEFMRKVREDTALPRHVAFMLSTSRRQPDISAAYELGVGGYFLKENVEDFVAMMGFYFQINRFPPDL